MIMPPFEGSRFKLKRARQHIEALKSEIIEFRSRVKIRAVPSDRKGNLITWRIVFSESPPADLPAIIGDAVHNLRAPLDIMMCDIARVRDKSTTGLSFPFAKDASDLLNLINNPRRSKIKRLGDDVVAAILKAAPHYQGNAALRALHDLDIKDKHQIVIPVFLVALGKPAIPEPAVTAIKQRMGLDLTRFVMPMRAGSQITLREGIDPRSAMRFLEEGPILVFPKGLPFAGKPIPETLESLAQMVDELIECFFQQFGSVAIEATDAPSGDDSTIERS